MRVLVYNFDACILGIGYGRRVVEMGGIRTRDPSSALYDRCGGEGPEGAYFRCMHGPCSASSIWSLSGEFHVPASPLCVVGTTTTSPTPSPHLYTITITFAQTHNPP